MELARSTYYYELSKRDIVAQRNKALMDEIMDIFDQHKGRYGVRRVHAELVNRGIMVNHKRVQRLMKVMGLKGKRPKAKYHSYKGETGKIAANIIDRDFSTTAPLEKWTTDVSQFSLPCGKCYLSPILDMNNNEIISYDLSLHPNMNQTQRMLDMAFEKFPDVSGLIFHSDQGWQYQHKQYQMLLKQKGIRQSMSRKGNCLDNSVMENFFGLLKSELLYLREFESIDEFRTELVKYIDYYNNKRIKSKLKGLSPVQYRLQSFVA